MHLSSLRDPPKEVEGAEPCCPNREGVAGADAAVAKLNAPPLDAAAEWR